MGGHVQSEIPNLKFQIGPHPGPPPEYQERGNGPQAIAPELSETHSVTIATSWLRLDIINSWEFSLQPRILLI